jgi:hypothetical protein
MAVMDARQSGVGKFLLFLYAATVETAGAK